MSHRKYHSQGSIPFSWEEKPGVSKFIHQKSSSDIGQNPLKILPENFKNPININPPPPCTSRFPRKSYSLKWQDDPFLAALKSCTKSVSSLRQKGNESKGKIYGKSVFSCKYSCDVENDNLLRFSKLLPPLPRERYIAKSFVMSLRNPNDRVE